MDGRDAPVLHLADAVGIPVDARVMGDDQDAPARRLRRAAQQVHDLVAGHRVEGAGGFVTDHQPGFVDQRTGDGDPLLLASGKLGGPLALPAAQTHLDQAFRGPGLGLTAPGPLEQEGHADILEQRQGGDEVELLEDEADVSPAEAGHFGRRERRDPGPHHRDLALIAIERPCQDAQEGGLAASRGPHDQVQFPLHGREVRPLEGQRPRVAHAERLHDGPRRDRGGFHRGLGGGVHRGSGCGHGVGLPAPVSRGRRSRAPVWRPGGSQTAPPRRRSAGRRPWPGKGKRPPS